MKTSPILNRPKAMMYKGRRIVIREEGGAHPPRLHADGTEIEHDDILISTSGTVHEYDGHDSHWELVSKYWIEANTGLLSVLAAHRRYDLFKAIKEMYLSS